MASSGNFAVFNPLSCQEGNGAQGTAADDLSNANTKFTITNDSSGMAVTIATPPSGGKWYCEFYLSGSVGNYAYVGYYPVAETPETKKQWAPSSNTTWVDTAIVSVHSMGRYFYTEGQYTDSGATSFTAGDIISIALDLDNGATYFAKNNTWMNSGNPESGSSKTGAAPVEGAYSKEYLLAVGSAGSTGHAWTINAGQDSTFGGAVSAGGNADENGFGDFKYAPPSGYLALCTANVPVSDDIDPAQTDDDYPGKQFGVVTYTGNATTGQAITGMGCQPDLVWAKCRSHAQSNFLSNTSRGINKFLFSDQIAAEASGGGYATVYSSFDSDGFTLGTSGSGPNDSGRTYVAWGWRANGGTTATNNDGNVTTTVQANAKAGFSIVTWTGTASNSRTLGTGLSKQAELVFVKNLDNGSYTTIVYHHNMKNGGLPNDYGILQLHGTNAYSEGSGALTYWDISEWSNSVFSVGGDVGINGSGNNMLAYCWHGVEGYSKFGYYNGNYATDGTFIYTGFRPRMLFVKRSDAANSWFVWDTERTTYNKMNSYLYWDLSNAEETGYAIDALSNGFKIRGQNNATNNNGGFFIYGAWGDVPFKYGNTF